jgi:RNA polymerase sigma factor (sigma-70 family)
MSDTQGIGFLRQMRRLVAARATARLSDRQLLEHFLARQDESAFAELVQRHGPGVLSLCRSLLRHEQDAEDVFQAAFLVLARKAASIRKREALGSWLYGVAYRLAGKVRARAARRDRLASAAAREPEAAAADDMTWRELRLVLHEELGRLPEKYRAPLLLCYWEGKTQEEAAAQLGWRKGTLKERVQRARELLRGRLTRRGVTLSAGLVTALLSGREGTAAQALALVNPTTRAATAFAAGHETAAGGGSATAAALAEGVVHAMFMTKLKIVAALLLTLGLLGAGASLAYQDPGGAAPAQASPAKPAQAKPGKAKTDKERLQGTWVAVSGEKGGKPAPEDFVKTMKITFAGDKVTFQALEETKEGTFKLGPAKKVKEIDLTHGDKTAKGIYRLEGDKLTLCFDDDLKADRPTEFEAGPGMTTVMLVLRRDKAAKGGKGDKGEADKGGKDPESAERLKLRIQQLQAELARARDQLKATREQLARLKAQAEEARAEALQQREQAEAVRRQAEADLLRARDAEAATRRAAERVRRVAAERPDAENLKRLVRAMHAYAKDHKRFPPAAVYDKTGKPLLSWRVLLLPYLDQKNLYMQFKLDEPWDSPHNKSWSDVLIKVYNPFAEVTGKTHYRVFTGPGTMFEGTRGVRAADVKDGLANTILIVEADEAVPWAMPDELSYDPKKPLPPLGKRFKGGFHIALADGTVRLVRPPVNEAALRAAITRNGGEPVDVEKLGK